MCNMIDAIESMAVEQFLNHAGSQGNLGLLPIHNRDLRDLPDADMSGDARRSGEYRTQYLLLVKTDRGVVPLGILYGPTQQHHMPDALPDSEVVRHLFQNISGDPDNENVYVAEPPEDGRRLSHNDDRVARPGSPALPAGEPLPSFDFDALIADVLKGSTLDLPDESAA